MRCFNLAKYGFLFSLGLWFCLSAMTSAQEFSDDPDAVEQASSERGWNLPLPTLGGKQFWTDHRWWFGWRVQYNNSLDHWRLIDPNGIRRAWGGRQAMLDELATRTATAKRPAVPEEYVILLHGLMRTSGSMKKLRDAIERDAQQGKRVPVLVAYASTRDSIDHHSAALRELIENLPGDSQISFVGHSLGNIVFRHALGHWQTHGDPKRVLLRLRRVVMLGPPNQGSSFAESLSNLGIFETVTGKSGLQLGPAWDEIQSSLGTPPCPFAIFAGVISTGPIGNPVLEGPNDGVVTLEEAKLPGAAFVREVPILHSFLMYDPPTVDAILAFLNSEDPR